MESDSPSSARETDTECCISSPDGARVSRNFDLRVCLALALLCLLIYHANMRVISAGDDYPARYLPFCIIGHGTLYLDSIEQIAAEGHARPFWMMQNSKGHFISKYPIVTPLLVSPLYLPAVAYLNMRGWTDQRLYRLGRLMEKVAASLVASLSVALMYLLLRRRAGVRAAILLTLAFGLGTNTWMIGSQGLWQHGTGELLLIVTLLLTTGLCTTMRALAAGAVCALIVFNRPPDAILAAPLGLYALWWAKRRAPWVVTSCAVTSIPLLAYNIHVAGSVYGGYSIMATGEFFGHSLPMGLAGLLFSPTRGLFVFTPFLVALPLGLWWSLRNASTRGLSILICAAFVVQLLLYGRTDWRGEAAWGPRFLTDVLPLLVWLLAPAVAGMARVVRPFFGLAVCASVAVQAVGAFWYTGASDVQIHSVTADGNLNPAWGLRNTPFLYEWRHHPPAPRDLLMKIEGGIDSINVDDRETREAAIGAQIVIRGWTLADNKTPVAVLVSLELGRGLVPPAGMQPPVLRTATFLPRAGTGGAALPPAPSEWTVALRTHGLIPGDYWIEVLTQASDESEYRSVTLLPFKLTAGASGNK